MSNKFVKFKAALMNLCEAHDVEIATSSYDSLQVWDRDPKQVQFEFMEDMTKQDDE